MNDMPNINEYKIICYTSNLESCHQDDQHKSWNDTVHVEMVKITILLEFLDY